MFRDGVFMRRSSFLLIFIIIVLAAFSFGKVAGDTYPPVRLLALVLAEVVEQDPALDHGEIEEEFIPDLRTVNLVAVGNIFPSENQIEEARVEEGVYDFSSNFEIIAPFLQKADFGVTDFETLHAGPPYSGWPYFNSPPTLSAALRDAGINLFAMGNNHVIDRGHEGLMTSLDHIRGLGITTFGAYKTPEEQAKPVIVEHDGIKIALISYTYSTNGIPIPFESEYIVNFTPDFIEIDPILEDINSARTAGADLVVVFPHWGEEHAHEPTPQRLRQVAEEFAAAGADLVIGGHPKYIQPLEWFFNRNDDGTERTTLAVYSRGNFFCHQRENDGHNSIYNEFGLLLDIVLTKNFDTGEVWISDVDYDVTWVYHDWRHRVIPVSVALNGSPDSYNLNTAQVERLSRMYDYFSNEAIERYGYSEDKLRAMAIADSNLNRAFSQ